MKTQDQITINTTQFGCGSIDAGDGTRIDVHMANNAGRGRDNVTLTRVSNETQRPAYTRNYAKGDVIGQTRTSGWHGKWSLNRRVREELGL